MRFPHARSLRVRRTPIWRHTERMKIDTNVYRERIDYDNPYRDTLTEREEELYWSAAKDAENALARIAKVQKRRKGENGEIKTSLLCDEFRKLNDAIEQLDEATTLLSLIIRAAAWTEQGEELRSEVLDEILDKAEISPIQTEVCDE